MKINVNKNTSGCSMFNRDRDRGVELNVDLNIGDIDDELRDEYISTAVKMLSDEMDDESVESALSRDIWDAVCRG